MEKSNIVSQMLEAQNELSRVRKLNTSLQEEFDNMKTKIEYQIIALDKSLINACKLFYIHNCTDKNILRIILKEEKEQMIIFYQIPSYIIKYDKAIKELSKEALDKYDKIFTDSMEILRINGIIIPKSKPKAALIEETKPIRFLDKGFINKRTINDLNDNDIRDLKIEAQRILDLPTNHKLSNAERIVLLSEKLNITMEVVCNYLS